VNTTTPADGTYTFRTHPYGARTLARFEGGRLTSHTYAGEPAPLTDFAAARIAHLVGYLDGVAFAPLTIGKARAAKLHRLMGRLGLCNPDHYGSARRAIGRDVFSLATLTEQEAREVWSYLCRTFPEARALAA